MVLLSVLSLSCGITNTGSSSVFHDNSNDEGYDYSVDGKQNVHRHLSFEMYSCEDIWEMTKDVEAGQLRSESE